MPRRKPDEVIDPTAPEVDENADPQGQVPELELEREPEETEPFDDEQKNHLATLSSSIPGGAVLGPDRRTWYDADGNPLPAHKVKEARAQRAERDDARAKLEQLNKPAA